MFALELIQTYMRLKNYTLDKQAAADLGFDRSMISKIRTGAKKLPEKSAIKIATECNLDIAEVLIKLQEEKASDITEKAAWSAILKKYKHGIIQVITMVYVAPIMLSVASHMLLLCLITEGKNIARNRTFRSPRVNAP